MTRAEQLSVGVTGALALAAVSAYAIDACGFGIAAGPVSAVAIAGAAALAWSSRPTGANRTNRADTLLLLAVVGFVFVTILRFGWPALVPPGRGPDLTHHLLLVDYIERHRELVHDRALERSMGEMAHYTPGAHLLAVLLGWWLRVDGLRAFFPLLAACAALASGFVFLIARRLALPAPYALAAVMLLFLPYRYFYGAFTHDAFLAQAVATLFAVASWWALVVWDQERSTVAAAIFSIALAAVFLTWPVFVGPLAIVFIAMAWRAGRPLVVGLAPMLVVAAVHGSGRWGWLGLIRTSGAVLRPGWASVGWLLPLLTLVGLQVNASNRRLRVTMVFLLVIVLQAIALFVIAMAQGADTPYMAFKMTYLAIYPMAILGAAGLAGVRKIVGDHDVTVGWAVAAILMLIAVRPAMAAPRAVPVIDLDLFEAGKWTRAHIGQTCIDYLVGDAETAYWLHLAVLGNPRAPDRMAEMDRYDPRTAAGPWITAEGRSYAIADVRLLPEEVRSRVEVVRTFGAAAVIKRPDVKMGDCDLGR